MRSDFEFYCSMTNNFFPIRLLLEMREEYRHTKKNEFQFSQSPQWGNCIYYIERSKMNKNKCNNESKKLKCIHMAMALQTCKIQFV